MIRLTPAEPLEVRNSGARVAALERKKLAREAAYAEKLKAKFRDRKNLIDLHQ